MPSTERSEVQKSLTLFCTFDLKIKITLKSQKYEPFIARVKEFNYKEEDPRVIFKRCEDTVFPIDSEGQEKDHYMVYIKNIKSAEKILDKK